MLGGRSKVKRYAYDLVLDNKFCYHQLNDEEREILTGLIIESKPIIHAYEYISEADARTEIPSMLAKYMQTRNSDLAKEIIELLCQNASILASREIDDLLKEAEEDYNFNKKYH